MGQGDLVTMEEVGDGTSSQDVESVASSGERGEVLSVVSSALWELGGRDRHFVEANTKPFLGHFWDFRGVNWTQRLLEA